MFALHRIRRNPHGNISGFLHHFRIVYFTELGSSVWIFVGIIIAGYPECFMIACKIELCQFIRHNKIFQIRLYWKFITETHAIFKNPENNIEQMIGDFVCFR